MGKLRTLSLFSGIGAFEKALDNIGINYELVNFSEIDKYAIKSYCAIHDVDESINLGDITKIDLEKLPQDIDLLTHGSPCQDYSLAGKQAGGDKGSGTRSSLMWNSVEIIRKIKPKYVIWENVKGVLSTKNKHNFEQYIKDLKEIGYTSSWKVLNSCDFGIPQNRERIFCVSVLDGEEFVFPESPNIPCKLKDVLEEIVDEKYYINKPFKFISKDDSNSVCRRVADVELNGHDYLKRVYDTEKCSPTLPTGTGGNHEPKILELDVSKRICGNTHPSGKGMNGVVYNAEYEAPTVTTNKVEGNKILVSCAISGRYDDDGKIQQQIETRKDDIANCITSVQKDSLVAEDYRVRKLTPKECWRLQAFRDDDFDKCVKVGMSNTQLYKQAGNSITVKVLEYIFKELFKEYIEGNN